jgi:hypothetical protein
MDGPTPEYKPSTPLALKMAWAAEAAVTRRGAAAAASMRCPWMFALIQSSGKLISHANAPLTPPATGMATAAGTLCSITVLRACGAQCGQHAARPRGTENNPRASDAHPNLPPSSVATRARTFAPHATHRECS